VKTPTEALLLCNNSHQTGLWLKKQGFYHATLHSLGLAAWKQEEIGRKMTFGQGDRVEPCENATDAGISDWSAGGDGRVFQRPAIGQQDARLLGPCRQELMRILLYPFYQYFEMQMRARRASG
jgi:hypothetical protein